MKLILTMAFFSLISSSAFSGLGSLAKLIVDGGIDSVIIKEGIVGSEKQGIENTIQLAIQSLKGSNENLDEHKLIELIESLPDTGEAGQIKTSLSILVKKSGDEANIEDLRALKSNLAYLAHHLGDGSAQLKPSCEQCGLNALSLIRVPNQHAQSFLNGHPRFRDQAKTFTFVRRSSRRLGLGDLRDAPEADYRAIAYFIDRSSRGTQKEKDFAQAVINLAKNSGDANGIFETNFYRFLIDNQNGAVSIKRMTELLNDAAEGCTAGTQASECFYQALDRRAANSPHLQEEAKKIRADGCFNNKKI